MKPEHHQNQDTNDRFMANIQRNGTFSVVPRIAAGEITPDGLIAIGQVAKKYKLYTKVELLLEKKDIYSLSFSQITGGQRIDMFGAMKDDLPSIWEELNNAGFESGHAYGKSLRTVKSCVGTTCMSLVSNYPIFYLLNILLFDGRVPLWCWRLRRFGSPIGKTISWYP